VPEIACVPDHAPDAVQDVAFVDDHVIVDDVPRLTFDWLRDNVTVGAGVATGAGVTVTGVDVPPPPPHPAKLANALNKTANSFLFICIPSLRLGSIP
jgi:hypothetical protein